MFFRSHWFGCLFLLPFLVMLCIHEVLGLSYSLYGVRVGEQLSPATQLYNLVMVGVFYLGIASFIAHAVSLVSRGKRWLFLKIALLSLCWGGLLWWFG